MNAEAVEVLARFAARRGAWLVHYSTDYVFSGDASAPYREDDAVAPQNVYGASKLAGEAAVRESGCRHLILRTSWIYGASGGSFIRAILKLARERESLEVVADQTGAPTGADLVAEVTAQCLARLLDDREFAASAGGTYHLAAGGSTTRHEWARYLVAESLRLGAPLKATPERVLPVPGSAFVTAAKRPANSLLDTSRLRTVFGVALPDWKVGREPAAFRPVSPGRAVDLHELNRAVGMLEGRMDGQLDRQSYFPAKSSVYRFCAPIPSARRPSSSITQRSARSNEP